MDDWRSGTADGTKVDLHACNGTAAQSWLYNSVDHTVHLALGGCLDVYNSDTASGSLIDRYTCNGSGAQQWDLGSNGSLVNP